MSPEQETLRDQISEAQDELGRLEQDLNAVDGELESLAARRHQFDLLEQACGSLEELGRLGAANLFWGKGGDNERTAEHVQKVRRQVEEFTSQVAKIEQRRQAVAEQIAARNESIGLLGEDLYDAVQQEERRKAEWVVEREASPLPFRKQLMPWMRGLEEDWRFRRSLGATMATALLLALLFPMIDLPLPERSQLTELPERVVKLIREEREIPVTPEPVLEEPVPEEEEPEPEPVMAEETPPEPVPEPVEEPEPAPREARQASVEEKVQSKGILAFREAFASRAQSQPSAELGSQARLGNAGDAAVGRPVRSMVTTSGPGSSGGINLGDISRNVGGGGGGEQISGVRVTRASSSIGSGDGGADRPRSGGGQGAGRTDEEIQIVFDRYKAALYRLYNRELRRDPTLRGQMVIRLTIEPDGSVSMCQLHSSDMGAPALAEQVLQRIRGFDFGAKEDIVTMTIIYPIDFLPAA